MQAGEEPGWADVQQSTSTGRFCREGWERGAAAAASACGKRAKSMANVRCGRRTWLVFEVRVTNFFDDFPVIEPSSLIESAVETVAAVFDILGMQFKEPTTGLGTGDSLEVADIKVGSVSQAPSPSVPKWGPEFVCLGVVADLQRAVADGVIELRNKASRKSAIIETLDTL